MKPHLTQSFQHTSFTFRIALGFFFLGNSRSLLRNTIGAVESRALAACWVYNKKNNQSSLGKNLQILTSITGKNTMMKHDLIDRNEKDGGCAFYQNASEIVSKRKLTSVKGQA